MPEARDRISRPVDVAALFARRRSAGVGILAGEPQAGAELFRSPTRELQQQQHQTTPTPAAAARTVERTPADFGDTTTMRGGGGVAATPRIGSWRGRYFNENSPASGSTRRVRGRGRGRSGVLPSWYPRTPLRDITMIARAIERRRARLRDGEVEGSESPLPEDLAILEPSSSEYVTTVENKASSLSAFRSKPYPLSVGKVPKILLGVANQNSAESDCLTPQKKLLNSIDSVEKDVMEELQKLKRTPTAKKAEREKRVRTLMSMR